MHLSTRHPDVSDSDMPDEVEYPHRFRLEPYHFDASYHNHDYWFDFSTANLACGFDPTPRSDEDEHDDEHQLPHQQQHVL